MIELVALDIAGTTVDEGGAVYAVLTDVVRDRGAPGTDPEIRTWMGADKREALRALLDDPGADVVEAAHAEFVTRLTARYRDTPPVPMAGVPEAFAALRAAGVRIALTTGFDRQVTDPLLTALGWAVGDPLDAVVCASEVAAGRPEPHMIRRAMELTGVTDPAHVLVAGDTVLDVRAGHAAGAAVVVGVLTGAQTRDELAVERPTHLLAGLHDLPSVLDVEAVGRR
ncbi:phosphonatase-like hydrolase [Pseudonocardia abyssalis]|jgi:phosphonatase-like hydrolase|uniref:Phosphonatase-like hydrolase n=1 Tax=Pseudonocardia abyssalis TaxID=2792008 RepID=A0ABS6USS5_9PSEU|nr:phosphonatase-like hydrolase [Pseudonocardia abyssalis]MBW0119039.1 phosphonatase-like hydrolase [Pseudonocardia abyssalis]MBW0135319.1 phosphonatase-like hydrolase [Pseudonocardia abyssalis]